MIEARLHLPIACLVLFAFARSAHGASEFTDYRIPDHHWSSWSLSAAGSGQHSQIDATQGTSTSGRVNFRLNNTALWGFDSDRAQHTLLLQFGTLGDRVGSRQETITPPTRSSSGHSRQVSEQFGLQATLNRFPWEPPVGFTFTGTFDAILNQQWAADGSVVRSGPDESRSVNDSNVHSYDYSSGAVLGLALGRVRDASPVYNARILEDRLLRTGALSAPLTPHARERLAGLLAVRGFPTYAHDRPERWFWREAERMLREEGALRGGTLDAYSLLRVLEGVSPGVVRRAIGMSFGPLLIVGAQRSHANSESNSASSHWQNGVEIGNSTFSSSSARSRRSNQLSVGWFADYHRPMGLRWQLDASDQLTWNDPFDALFMQNRASVTWMIADRWLASSGLSQFGFSNDRSGGRKLSAWSFGTDIRLEYLLEDAWALGLVWSHNQSHDRVTFRRDDSVSFGVTYRLSGHFSAPGLLQPMSLSPPTP